MSPFKFHNSLILLCFALLWSSCAKDDGFEERFESKVVVEANLEVGSPISDFHVHELLGQGKPAPFSDLDITISTRDMNISLTEMEGNPGHYAGPEDVIIEAEVAYEFHTSFAGKDISAVTVTPPSMEALEASKHFIDAEIQGDLVFLEWSGVNTGTFNEYFYVLELTPQEEDPEHIMRFNGETTTTTVVSFVPEATLSINDFNFYGEHLIRVHAVSKDYQDLFMPQASQNQDGPATSKVGMVSSLALA